jgi:hypothetical protein
MTALITGKHPGDLVNNVFNLDLATETAPRPTPVN